MIGAAFVELAAVGAVVAAVLCAHGAICVAGHVAARIAAAIAAMALVYEALAIRVEQLHGWHLGVTISAHASVPASGIAAAAVVTLLAALLGDAVARGAHPFLPRRFAGVIAYVAGAIVFHLVAQSGVTR